MNAAKPGATQSMQSGSTLRLVDVIASALGLIVLSPVLMGLSVVIALSAGRPIFYKSPRVGKGGRRFKLYKFRTMVVDADKQGPSITTSEDRRITRVGAWLRRYKLDELPQLWNVLKGEMSLVGPRPEAPGYVERYTVEQRQVLAVRPGITSVASLAYRHEAQLLAGPDWETIYCDEILPAKLAMELAYLQRRTLWSDLVVILRTLVAVFKRAEG